MWLITVVGALALWGTLTVTVDPYGILGTRIVRTTMLGASNRLMAEDGDRSLKAFELLRNRSETKTVILGSSRALMGFDPESRTLQPLRPYNAGLSAMRFEEGSRIFEFVVERCRPARVVWLLDFDLFFLPMDLQVDFDRSAFAGRPLSPTLLRFLLSNRAAQGTFAILSGRNRNRKHTHVQTSRGLLLGGFLDRDGEGQRRLMAQEVELTLPQFVRERERFSADLDRHARTLSAALAKARLAGVEVFVALAPVQIWRRVMIDKAGLGSAFEAFKQRLAQEIEDVNRSGGLGAIELWDFARLHPFTAESPPVRPGDPPMRHFWESSHFRPTVGDQLIGRMLPTGVPDAHPNFGVRLTGANVDHEIQRDAAALAAWQNHHRELLNGLSTAANPEVAIGSQRRR
jgi:hypothetical protein